MDHKKTPRLLVTILENLLVFEYDRKSHLLSYVKCQQACSLKLSENSCHFTYHFHEIDGFAAFKFQGHCICDLYVRSYYLHSYIQIGFRLFWIHLLSSDFGKNYASNFNRFFEWVIQNLINHKPIEELDHFSYLSPNQDFWLGSKAAHLERVLYLTAIHLIFYAVQFLMVDHGDDLVINCGFDLITSVIIKKCDFTHELNLLCIFCD